MSTLTRRELLSKSTTLLLLVPVARAAMGCSSSSNPSSGPSPETEDGGIEEADCNGVFEVSTVTNSHTHTLCVPTTDLASPPAAGIQYTTSYNDAHDHTVVLTQAQLQSINGGGSVTVTTSSPYPHNFTISKAT